MSLSIFDKRMLSHNLGSYQVIDRPILLEISTYLTLSEFATWLLSGRSLCLELYTVFPARMKIELQTRFDLPATSLNNMSLTELVRLYLDKIKEEAEFTRHASYRGDASYINTLINSEHPSTSKKQQGFYFLKPPLFHPM